MSAAEPEPMETAPVEETPKPGTHYIFAQYMLSGRC